MNSEHFSHPTLGKNIYLIDMTRERGYFSEMAKKGIQKYIRQGKKILLLINKKGYASGLLCTQCGYSPQCKNCSISIGYHEINHTLLGLCHICKHSYDLPKICPQCNTADKIKLYGLTTQKTKERLQSECGVRSIIIESKKVSSINKIKKTQELIKNNNIIIGTNIAGDLQSNFDLIIVLSADQSLSLPDYNVRKNSFIFLEKIITKSNCPTILIQSYDTKHDSIRYACKIDRTGFIEKEKEFRSQHHYPPYGGLCVIKYNNQNETTLHNTTQKLYKELLYLQEIYQYTNLTIYSTPPLIYKKFGKFYYHIIVLGEKEKVRVFMDICHSKLKLAKRNFKIERMAKGVI